MCFSLELSLLWSTTSLYLNLCLSSALRSAQIFLPKRGCPLTLPTKLFPFPFIAKQIPQSGSRHCGFSPHIPIPLVLIKSQRLKISDQAFLQFMATLEHLTDDPSLPKTPSPPFKDELTHQSGGSVIVGWGGTNPGIRAYLSRLIFTN